MKYPKYFATGNKNKLTEVNSILPVPLEQIEIDLEEVQALDVVEVAERKAIEAYNKIGESVLVEDTGVSFMALNGFPGALIKWLLESLGNEGIVNLLAPYKERGVIARTVFAYFNGEEVQTFTGEMRGTVPEKIAGIGGFGWDPLFIPDGHTETLAEMTPEEKNTISSRKIALAKLVSIK